MTSRNKGSPSFYQKVEHFPHSGRILLANNIKVMDKNI